MGRKLENVVGNVYGRLTIIADEDKRDKNGQRIVMVECQCGNIFNVLLSNLTRSKGSTKSCNCIRNEKSSKRMIKLNKTLHITYGKTDTSTYRIYRGIIQRTSNKNHKQYKYYGGRGITICERWQGKHGFENFLSDVGERPGKEYSIDRINNDLGYSPENCAWRTKAEQNKNRRKPGQWKVDYFVYNFRLNNIQHANEMLNELFTRGN